MCKYSRLKDLREDNEKTQEQIAQVIGTTFQYYSAYERGIRDIPFSRIIKLAKYYNVTIDYIAGLTNDPKPNWNISDKQEKNTNNKSLTIKQKGKNNKIGNIKL